MTTLQAQRVALDENAITFITTFMTHVTTLTDRDMTRAGTAAGIEILLLAAIERGAGESSSEWRALYRAIAKLVDTAFYTYDTRAAYRYLRDFIRENEDLALRAR
jgi:hypothetical protein